MAPLGSQWGTGIGKAIGQILSLSPSTTCRHSLIVAVPAEEFNRVDIKGDRQPFKRIDARRIFAALDHADKIAVNARLLGQIFLTYSVLGAQAFEIIRNSLSQAHF